jgi:hypothetical protein
MRGHQPFTRREQISESRQLEHEMPRAFLWGFWAFLLSATYIACIVVHAAVSAGMTP